MNFEDPDGDKLSYSWKQISGLPRVRIFDETNPTASFYAPSDVIRDTNLTFELTVYDNRGMEDKSNTTVTVLYNRNNDIQLFINKGMDLLTLGRYTDAIDSFNQSLAIDPNNTLALDDKADALIFLGHNIEAKKIEDKSLSLNNSDTIAMANEAAILRNSKNYTGALRYYDKALSIDPNSTWTLNQEGLTLYSLRNYTGAVDIYNKALSINHTYTDAQDNRKAALDALKTSKQ